MNGQLRFDGPSECSLQAKDMLRRLLEPDPAKRMSAKEALHHPWILGRKSFQSLKSCSHLEFRELSPLSPPPKIPQRDSFEEVTEISDIDDQYRLSFA
jgi:serine/threonine protein kinase